jgi:hypothetical protein
MSRLAVGERNRRCCSSVPNAANTGPTIAVLKLRGGGTHVACISVAQMCRCTSVQSRPPCSSGHAGTATPAAFSACCVATMSSREAWRPLRTLSRISAGTRVVKISRISSANARSSSLSPRCMPATLVQRPSPLAGAAGSEDAAKYLSGQVNLSARSCP